jgi:hypothetical protein
MIAVIALTTYMLPTSGPQNVFKAALSMADAITTHILNHSAGPSMRPTLNKSLY